MSKRKTPQPLPHVGWREWVGLPALGVGSIKAKVDTGARSSSLHAYAIREFVRDGKRMLSFTIHPIQREVWTTITAEAELLEYRHVRSSSGHHNRRPVILTPVQLFDQQWEIELTLASRDEMGFRMLLGRQAVRGRFLIDPARSYFAGEPADRPPQAEEEIVARAAAMIWAILANWVGRLSRAQSKSQQINLAIPPEFWYLRRSR